MGVFIIIYRFLNDFFMFFNSDSSNFQRVIYAKTRRTYYNNITINFNPWRHDRSPVLMHRSARNIFVRLIGLQMIHNNKGITYIIYLFFFYLYNTKIVVEVWFSAHSVSKLKQILQIIIYWFDSVFRYTKIEIDEKKYTI